MCTLTRVTCESGNWFLRWLLPVFKLSTPPLKGQGACQSHKTLGVPLILRKKGVPLPIPRVDHGCKSLYLSFKEGGKEGGKKGGRKQAGPY